MPTYEYQCNSCGETFDIFQSITARPLRRYECPSCGTVRSVRRLIGTGGAILFKGPGFYQTDYRSKSYQQAAKADTGSAVSTSSESGKNSTSSQTTSADGKTKQKKKTSPCPQT